MPWNLQNWIETVKGKPEHVRERYVYGCVAASMFFIIIIWSLSMTELFKGTVAQTEEVINEPGGILPKPSDFSLDELVSGKSADGTGLPKSGEEFLREQTENRARLNPDEEGVVPKSEAESTEETVIPVR